MSLLHLVNTITEFGDAAVLLPVAFALFSWLLCRPGKGAAIWWIVALAVCVATTAALKIYLYPCPEGAGLRNPSGHASLSVLVYGGIATVLAAQFTGWRRRAIIGGTASVVGFIGASRVLTDAHTPPEVILGLAIGLFSVALFAHQYRPSPVATPSWRALCISILLLVAILHGRTLSAEDFLHHVNAYIGLEPAVCP